MLLIYLILSPFQFVAVKREKQKDEKQDSLKEVFTTEITDEKLDK